MAPAFNRTSDCLVIEGELTVLDVREARDALLPWLDTTATPVLDLSGVTEFDSAAVLLLLLASRRAAAQGKTLTLLSPAPAVCDVLDLCQATELLDLICEAA